MTTPDSPMRGCLASLFQEFVLVPLVFVAVFAVVLTAKLAGAFWAVVIGVVLAAIVGAVLFVRTQRTRR